MDSPDLPSFPPRHPDLSNALAASARVLDQTPPPSLREILGAYKSRGDGDRDMLLAMLNAKSAEDQRLASVAALHRQVLEIYHSPASNHLPHLHIPTDLPPPRHYPSHRRSRSPPRPGSSSSGPPRDAPPPPPRKRHRSSRSPPAPASVPNGVSHELPPSPRSDSAEYSPRSRASMAIGSLLSAGAPRRDDDAHQYSGSVSAERTGEGPGLIHVNHGQASTVVV